MSYAFDLTFLRADSRGDAFDTAWRASEARWESFEHWIFKNRYYIPSRRFCSPQSDERPGYISEADRNWLELLGKDRFVYFPGNSLVAIVGDGWPDKSKTNARHIFFQNSCDQDYPFEVFRGLDDDLDEEINKLRTAALPEVNRVLNLGSRHVDYSICEDDDLDYYRRTAAYNLVYCTLHLDDWLWGRDDPAFVRFAFSCITTPERKFDAEQMLRRTPM